MIPVNFKIDDLTIRNLGAEDLKAALDCINQDEESCRTLGLLEFLLYEELEQRYLETLMNSLEYFCGVYTEQKLIGIIKGRIENKHDNELWVLSLLLLRDYRARGIGSKVLQAFEAHFSKHYSVGRFGIIILNSNKKGLNFWIKNNYCISRKASSIGLDKEDMVILYKLI